MKRQMISGTWLRVALSVLAPATSHAQSDARATEPPQGSLCIVAVSPAAPGDNGLKNGGNRIKRYTIKIDDSAPIRVLPDKGVAAPPLSLGDRHVVRVFGDGKQVVSFRFSFGDYSTNELCLGFNDFYETWSVRDCEDAGTWGTCGPRHRLPWVEVKSCEVVGKHLVPMRPDPQVNSVEYYTDYKIRYVAEGREFFKYTGSGLPPDVDKSSADVRALPKACRYTIRYHPGMPDKAVISLQ